ncbi:MAG: HAMP domain-containing histidine kinase [Cyclobacteriaceae bacterium]|nr:HAMP domain-containing histidine kinase [Cyclobacteriaceae bacterium]
MRFKLSRLTIPEGVEFDGTQKQNIVLSQLALLVILISSIHLIDDGLITPIESKYHVYLIVIEFMLGSMGLITYILNERRYHGIAKHFFLLSSNILLFFLNAVVPKESGSYFFYFPLMAGTFIFYGYSETIKRYFYLVLTSGMFITLTILNFNIFGLQVEMDIEYDFLTNLLSSIILMVMTVRFLIKLNQKTEGNLVNHQQELRILMEELKKKNIHLEKVNTELDKFAYSVSHDLRAPLSSILGLINLSLIENSKEKYKQYMGMMKNMVHKLDDFIHDIMNYSRNSKLEIKQEEVDFNAIVKECVSKHKFMNGWEKIDFILNIDLEKPVFSDKDRISIVINNLISNSVKYHDYEKDNPYIKVDVFSKNGTWGINVKDNGLGIEKEYVNNIFDMFYRGNENSTGSGLGLYIVKEISDKMKADLSVKSEISSGTTISLLFN